MNKVRLKDVSEITMGQSPDSSSYNTVEDGLPFFQGNADFGEVTPKVRVWCSSPKKIAQKDDILISVRAPIGALNIANQESCIGRGLASIRVDEKTIDKKYLWYYLNSKVDYLNAQGTGSTFKAINKNVLADLQIKIYDINQQQSIVSRLNMISFLLDESIRCKNKLDELIKSRFVEMFGTIHNNVFGYEIKSLQRICEMIKDGTHKTPEYTEDTKSGYIFLSSKNVTSMSIDWTHTKYIPKHLHDELYAKIAPRKGDILLAKNGTTGVAAIVDKDEVFDIYVSLALLRPISVDSVYLWAAINSPETKYQFDSSLKGIGVPNLHLGEIKKTRIIVPPLEQQTKFADFVTKVEHQKAAVQKSLEKLETLKKSLMQEYFG